LINGDAGSARFVDELRAEAGEGVRVGWCARTVETTEVKWLSSGADQFRHLSMTLRAMKYCRRRVDRRMPFSSSTTSLQVPPSDSTRRESYPSVPFC
jgi:hypothetical protein